jgi:hypothetical protein
VGFEIKKRREQTLTNLKKCDGKTKRKYDYVEK